MRLAQREPWAAPSADSRITIRHLGETLAVARGQGRVWSGARGLAAGPLASVSWPPGQCSFNVDDARVFVLVGISLGAGVTPETLHGMATYPLSIAVLLVAWPSCCWSRYLQPCTAGQSRRISGSGSGGMSQCWRSVPNRC